MEINFNSLFYICSKVELRMNKLELKDIGLGNKIRKARRLRGFSQEYMASKLELSQRGYSKIETNEVNIDSDRFSQIANILEMDATEIMSLEDDKQIFNISENKIHTAIVNQYVQELENNPYIQHLKTEIEYLQKTVQQKEEQITILLNKLK